MNRRALRWLLPVAALALVALALGWVFSMRLGGGDSYPPYSSFRADALGTRALYEALETLPNFQVERHLKPLARLGPQPRLILLPGLLWHDWEKIPATDLAALNAAANAGSTVVLAFESVSKEEEEEWVAAEKRREEREAEAKKRAGDEDETAKDAKKKTKHVGPRRGQPPEEKPLVEAWQVAFGVKTSVASAIAERDAAAPAELTHTLEWHSELTFQPVDGSPWRTLYVRGGAKVAVVRPFGAGRIVLLGDAFCLSNEAMQRERATGLLAWLVGPHTRAVVVENALGLGEENGVGFLARRYGLGGALALLALLAALYLWRRAVAFYPVRDPLEAGGEIALGYEPSAGLTALLRRALGAGAVLPACVEEWRAARRAGGNAAATARFDAAWAARDSKATPVETYNTLVRELKPR